MTVMRTSFGIIGAVAGMAAFLVSCNKQEIASPESKTIEMTIVAGTDETKTVLESDGSVTWSATGEQLAVIEQSYVGKTPAIAKATSKDGVSSDERVTMTFGVSLTSKTADSFNYYALYPNSAYVSSSNTNVEKFKVALVSTQTPTSTSFGPEADILVSKPVKDLKTQPEDLNLQFARVIAVGKMTIKNLNTSENVKKVTFTATGKPVTGRSYIDLTTAAGVEYGYPDQGVDNVVLDYTGKEIAANGMTAYFTCWPFELSADETFSVEVETENYIFTKNVTLTEGKTLAFNVGRSSSFNVNFKGIEGVEKVRPTVYTLVEDDSKIQDGAEYIIVNGQTSLSNYNTDKKIYDGVTVTAENKKINITTEAVNVITLESGDADGQYYLLDSDNSYIQYNSGSANEVYRGEKTADDDYDLWTVSADKITNVGNSNRVLQKNNSSARFACYAGTQTNVTLYVNEATLIPALAKPTTLVADAEGSTVTVVWEAVENAESYDVTCAGQTQNVTTNEATFTDVADGTYEVSVVAKASAFKNSEAAVTSVIVGTPTLDKPVIKTVSETANGFYAELEGAVQYAESYTWDLYEGPVENGNWVGTGTNSSEKFSITVNETDFKITELAPETTYYLVITAKATGYKPSESVPASFTTATEANDGSLEKPFTAAEAITAIDAGGDLTNKYVKGVITEVTSFNSTYGSITYNIESGEKTLTVYGGLDLGSGKFTSINDLKVGDEVLACGELYKYKSTYELKENNYIVTLNGLSEIYVGLKVSGQTTTFTVGDEFVFGGTVLQDWRGKDDVDVTGLASFSGYDMNAEGIQTVTVTVGTESVEYNITVKAAGIQVVTLGSDWNTLFGTNYTGQISGIKANEFSLNGSSDNVTITVANGTSKNGYVKTSDFRAYNGYIITLSVPEGKKMTAISTTKGGKTFTSGIEADSGTGSISNNAYTWSGSSQQVVLKITGSVSFATIVVTYE